MLPKILIVDDKLNVQKLISDFLIGKEFEVSCVSNGRDAISALNSFSPDLILLDVMMPHMDGYEFISELRKTSDLPVIMVTAKQHESDLIKGFDLGADDYITKPFRMSELLVRVKAVLKRSSIHFSPSSQLKVANLILDTKSKELRIDEQLVELTMAELALLSLLMKSVEHTVTKADICQHLISLGYSGSEATLKIHIRNLRNKLEPLAQDQVYIESIFAVGYRLRKVTI